MNIERNNLFHEKGFTLIELVVAFSIMAILSTVGIASFVSYSRTQTMQQAVSDFTTALNTAKAASVAQTLSLNISGVNLTCPAGRAFEGYGIVINSPVANSYRFYVRCTGVKTYSAKETILPTNINFDASTTTQDVFFAVLTGGVVGGGNIVFNGINLGLKTKTISIDLGGNILIPTPTPTP